MKTIFLVLSAVFLSALYPSFLYSEVFTRDNQLDRLDELKRVISGVLAENNQLEVEYALLYQEFQDARDEYHSRAAELMELKAMEERQKNATAEREEQFRRMGKNLPDVESEELLLKSRIALLRQQLLDDEEAERLISLKIADEERASRQLVLAKKSTEFEQRTSGADEERLLNDLKHLYEKNLEREQEFLRLIDQRSEDGSNHAVTMGRLVVEIRDFREQIRQLESRKDFRQQEQSLLRNKRLYEVRLTEDQIWRNEQLKISLEKNVNALDEEYQRLNRKVASSLEEQTRQRRLLDQMIEIDSENQRLKEKILEIEPKVKALE
jgi:hypothetical protein